MYKELLPHLGRLLPHLESLDRSSSDIEASVFISTEGLVIATTLPYLNPDHIGAICAGAFRLGHQVSEKIVGGVLEQILIKCSVNQIVITRAGTKVILAVITKPSANLEQVFFCLKQSIENMTDVI